MPLRADPSRLTPAHIACSLAFFRKDHSVPFCSDIPGRPETQVGRWHVMRRTGEVELTEDIEWKASPREQRFSLRIRRTPVRSLCFSLPFMLQPSSENRTFIQSSPLQTMLRKVLMTHSRPFRWRPRSVPLLHSFMLSGIMICYEVSPFRLIHAVCDGETISANLQ